LQRKRYLQRWKGEEIMIKRILVIFWIFIITGCAGIQHVHTSSNIQIDKSKKYLVFPFRDPSLEILLLKEKNSQELAIVLQISLPLHVPNMV